MRHAPRTPATFRNLPGLRRAVATIAVWPAPSSALAAPRRPGRPTPSRGAPGALPEPDPGARGTVQAGARPLGEAEQVAVRLGRTPEGRVVVLQVLSPALTLQQEEAIRRGFETGEWRREVPLSPTEESWIENVTRVRR